MEEYELISLIRKTIREELAPILMGKIKSTNTEYRAVAQRFSGENEISQLRLLHPYGLASRPPAETECVVMPILNDPTHLNILTQHDLSRPPTQEGEVCLYGPEGQVVYLKKGGVIHIGTQSASEPFLLGQQVSTWLSHLIDAILAITYVENSGGPVTGTANAATFQNLKEKLQKLLSQKIFGE
jgi:phage gp45-like